jgi:hypothetical protein
MWSRIRLRTRRKSKKLDPDAHLSKKTDPDPNSSEKLDLDPYLH